MKGNVNTLLPLAYYYPSPFPCLFSTVNNGSGGRRYTSADRHFPGCTGCPGCRGCSRTARPRGVWLHPDQDDEIETLCDIF
ncbi:hypothetical protein BDA96_02G401900 [Sorghum bicolor]|uniref:Uncharacterized protein n=2 Tax=Sorghum bicolor TaxID=4558 RepID=A0A921RUV3_SORBI|nr:hypothetical protein BDA96_02G401900 [Sorghum bicolor]OQU90302.1 hypothetical protein SORBI_3002G382950 [Sorghum bicolor]